MCLLIFIALLCFCMHMCMYRCSWLYNVLKSQPTGLLVFCYFILVFCYFKNIFCYLYLRVLVVHFSVPLLYFILVIFQSGGNTQFHICFLIISWSFRKTKITVQGSIWLLPNKRHTKHQLIICSHDSFSINPQHTSCKPCEQPRACLYLQVLFWNMWYSFVL